MRKKTLTFYLGCIICLSVSLSGCLSNSTSTTMQHPKTIKIGVMYPTSGDMEHAGKNQVKGIEFAAKLINEKYDLAIPLAKGEGLPNLGGAKIELIIVDSEGSPKEAVAKAEKLITEEKAAAIIGAYDSSNTAAASQTTERYGIPFLNAESTSHHLTERGYKWFFRTNADNELAAKGVFDFFTQLDEDHAVKSIAFLHDQSEVSQDFADAQNRLAEKSGREVVSDRLDSNQMNFGALKLKEDDPDVITMTTLRSAIQFRQTANQQSYSPNAMIGMSSGMETSEETLGKEAEGLLISAGWSKELLAKPLINKVNALYKAETGEELSGYTPHAITGMLVLADAINRAESIDSDKIRKALLATDYPADSLIMPWNGVRFDQDTQQNKSASNVLLQVKDGTEKLVWPFDIATEELVWPLIPAEGGR